MFMIHRELNGRYYVGENASPTANVHDHCRLYIPLSLFVLFFLAHLVTFGELHPLRGKRFPAKKWSHGCTKHHKSMSFFHKLLPHNHGIYRTFQNHVKRTKINKIMYPNKSHDKSFHSIWWVKLRKFWSPNPRKLPTGSPQPAPRFATPTNPVNKKKTVGPKLTAKAPENGWLEYDRFLLGFRPFFFRGYVMLVSGRATNVTAPPVRWSLTTAYIKGSKSTAFFSDWIRSSELQGCHGGVFCFLFFDHPKSIPVQS